MQRGTSSDRIDNESKVVSRIPRPPNNRSKSSSESRKIGTETTKKHENVAVERSEVFGVTLQTLGEAPKSGLGRVREAPRALSGRPGRSQEAPRAPRSASGEPPRATRTTPGRSPRAFGTPKRVRTATTSDFHRFLARAWKGRTSIFASQRSVLLTWDEERTERQHAAKKWRRDTIFEPKIVSGGHPGALVERKNGLCGRSRALEAPPESLRNFFVGASEARSARKCACKAMLRAKGASAPAPLARTFGWIIWADTKIAAISWCWQ